MCSPRRPALVAAALLLPLLGVLPAAASPPSAGSAFSRVVSSAGASASSRMLSSADAASFRRLQTSLGGTIGLAVSPLGQGRSVQRLGSLRTGVAWSTSKVPVAMAVVASGRGKQQAANLRQAITASDNAAAERLWASLGSGQRAARAATAQLRNAGDRRTRVRSARLRPAFTAYGQTTWTLADQARFTAGLRCLKAGRSVLKLMGQTVSSQRWGLGRVGSVPQIKGGWGPGVRAGVDGGYFDRQMGIVTIRGRPLAVAIASLPADGSHATGTRNLTRIARWLAEHVDVSGASRSARCR